MTPPSLDLFVMTLQVVVPLRLAELEALDPRRRKIAFENWRRQGVDAITAQGDILQYGSKRRGEVAKAFNAAALGITVGSTVPGGITICGVVFCARHHPGGGKADGQMCPECLADEGDRPAPVRHRRGITDVQLPAEAGES